jgi:hypothetical protein
MAATWAGGSEPRLTAEQAAKRLDLEQRFYALACAFEAHAALAKAA